MFLNQGKNYLKIHFNDDVPLNVSSVQFERIDDGRTIDFKALREKLMMMKSQLIYF